MKHFLLFIFFLASIQVSTVQAQYYGISSYNNVDDYMKLFSATGDPETYKNESLAQPTRFTYPQVGFSLELPETAYYAIKARTVQKKDDGSIEIVFNDNEKLRREKESRDEEGYANSLIRNILELDDLNMSLSIFSKEDKYLPEYLSRYETDTNNPQYEKVDIGTNIKGASAYVFGNEIEGFYSRVFYEKNGYLIELVVYTYSLKSQKDVSDILKTIRVDDQVLLKKQRLLSPKSKKKEVYTYDINKIEELDLNAVLDEDIVENPFKSLLENDEDEDTKPKIHATKIELPDFNVSFYLPIKRHEFYLLNKGERALEESSVLTDMKPDEDEFIFGFGRNFNVSLLIYKTPQTSDIFGFKTRDFLDLFFDQKESTLIRYGRLVSNGITWTVYCYSNYSHLTLMASTIIDGYEITIPFVGEGSVEDLEKNLTYIRTFKFSPAL